LLYRLSNSLQFDFLKESLRGGITISVCDMGEFKRFRDLIVEIAQPDSLHAHEGLGEKDR